MTAEEANERFCFTDKLIGTSDVKCPKPKCQIFSPLTEWDLGCYWCGTCQDDHWTMVCPQCCDTVETWDAPLEVKPPNES